MEKASQDYGKLLQQISVDKEINPICMNIEDMLTRLEELESLLANVKGESNIVMDQYASSILAFSPNFNDLKQHIDKLDKFVEIVGSNVDEVETSLNLAEADLNITDYSLKGLLAKAMSGAPGAGAARVTNDSVSNMKDGDFQTVPIFKTDNFFNSDDVSNSQSETL